MASNPKHAVLSIFCRLVGPGGTSVDFFPRPEGLKAVWTNENCPYSPALQVDEATGAAHDAHNVSEVSWAELAAALQWGISEGFYELQDESLLSKRAVDRFFELADTELCALREERDAAVSAARFAEAGEAAARRARDAAHEARRAYSNACAVQFRRLEDDVAALRKERDGLKRDLARAQEQLSSGKDGGQRLPSPVWFATYATADGGPDWSRREEVREGWVPADGEKLYSLELSRWEPWIDKLWYQAWLRDIIAPRVVPGGRVDGLIWTAQEH